MAVNSATANAAPQITGAIRQAAKTSGISFEYLLTTAQIESNLNPSAQASTSSAKGLYQFIEQTWLGTMKADGPANGYGKYADAISRSPDGRYDVADPSMRAAIMQLRSDPSASAAMAGAFTRTNAEQLQGTIGRAPSEGELYIAHFLGPDGAGKLIGAATAQPRANAAEMFPQAAAANPSIFYDRAGHSRSTGDVYAKLSGRFDVARAMSFAPGVRTAANTVAMTIPKAGAAKTSSPDTAGVTQAFAQANDRLPPLPDTKPLFQAMFTDRARKAVTQTVSSLWAPAKSETKSDAKTEAPSAAKPARPLDNLFTDTPTDTRKMFRGSV
jgi:hypothetical protein